MEKFEPPHDKTNKMSFAPSEDSDQTGHPPSLTRVFVFRMKKAWVLSYPLSAQRRTMIRLGGCPGWSESSLGAQPLCLFCHVAAHLSVIDWSVTSLTWSVALLIVFHILILRQADIQNPLNPWSPLSNADWPYLQFGCFLVIILHLFQVAISLHVRSGIIPSAHCASKY